MSGVTSFSRLLLSQTPTDDTAPTACVELPGSNDPAFTTQCDAAIRKQTKLLSTLPSSQWLGVVVALHGGTAHGHIGMVIGVKTGWVAIKLANGSDISKRLQDLFIAWVAEDRMAYVEKVLASRTIPAATAASSAPPTPTQPLLINTAAGETASALDPSSQAIAAANTAPTTPSTSALVKPSAALRRGAANTPVMFAADCADAGAAFAPAHIAQRMVTRDTPSPSARKSSGLCPYAWRVERRMVM